MGYTMSSKIRLYMAFDAKWIMTLVEPAMILYEAIKVGLKAYGEECTSFRYTDGVVFIELVSDNRDGDVLKDIVFETLLNSFPFIHESDFDIEIDLDINFDETDV